jgi:hypothetical protein
MPILYFRATRVATEQFKSKIRYERQVNISIFLSTTFFQIYFQVIVIGLINFTASGIYDVIQLFPISLKTTLLGTGAWFLSQGMTSVVYLLINKNIRYRVLRKFGFRSAHIGYISSTHHQKTMTRTTTNAFSQNASSQEVQKSTVDSTN